MIDLSNYPKFERDIQSNQTSLIPLIIVDPESENPIYISTVRGIFNGDTFWEDMGLKISSIKESINLESSKFKTNNISLTLSNFKINGQRFTDVVLERGLLNKTIDVYYKTQSCTELQDCMLLYRGNIKRFDHDDRTVKIQLEDKTEDKINQQIPKANTGYKSNVYSKDYLNKPIPMLYGLVNKAPAMPFLSEANSYNLSKIFITCDDTLATADNEPRITLGNTFTDPASESFLPQDSINPLYIYKDDYFQVLENYNLDVITGSISDWTWANYDQYTIKNGYLEVLKKYQGITALNPPADNELQCVKLRFPNDFITLPNPSNEDDEWYDSGNFGVTYEQPAIKSRELAFDNPFFSESKSSYYTIASSDYKETFSQIPDATINVGDTQSYIVQDFQPDRIGKGIINQLLEGVDSESRSQYEVLSYLMRYAHVNNSEDDPRIQFVRIPSAWMIYSKISGKVRDLYSAVLIELGFPEEFITEQVASQLTVNMNPLSSSDVDINSSASLSKGFCYLYLIRQGFTASTAMSWLNDNWIDNGEMWAEPTATDPDSFFYLHNDGSAQGKTAGQSIDYPNFFIRFGIKDEQPSLSSPVQLEAGQVTFNSYYESGGYYYELPSFREVLGKQFATISLKNNNLHSYNDAQSSLNEIGLYYNLYDLDDGENYLYSNSDSHAAIYTPLNLTHKSRSGTNNRCSHQKYDCAWNGTSIHSNQLSQAMNILYPNNSVYFGRYSSGDWTSTTYKVHPKHTLANSVLGDNSGWFIWVKKDIPPSELGTEPPSEGEWNMPFPNLRIEKNTLIPMINLVKPRSDQGSSYANYNHGDASLGTQLSLDASKITINKPSETSSRRFTAVFPFEDQDISDAIHTDTFFSGKIRLKFDTSDTGTTATDENSLKVVLGAVDVNPENNDIDWEVFDQALDGAGAILIDQTLNDCRTNSTTIYDTFDESPEITNQIPNTHNFYTDLPPVNDVFHEVNNYNSLAMIFRLEGDANIPENIARFNLDIYSVSLLHYIVFEAAFDSPLYINQEGRINLTDEIGQDNNFKYTGEIISNADDESRITKPCDIIYHIIEKELDLIDFVDLDAINKTRNNLVVDEMAFSVFENIKAKDLIQKICQSSNMFALFKGTSLFSFTSINASYGSSDAIIIARDVIDYSFTRTPIEKVNTIVNVKYKKDYAEDEYMEETGYVDAYDMFGNKDLGYESGYSYDYLGLDREDRVLEFESDFIRTRGTAEALRDFILMNTCNQHNIIKMTLPLKYMYLEVGDIVQFDSVIQGVKIYGEDYTRENQRNGQTIFPYFIIDSIDKKQKNISVKVTQLHNLIRQFSPQLGSITRTTSSEQGFNYSIEDYNQLENFLFGAEKYYTQEQKRVSDLNLDSYIDQHDLTSLHTLLNINNYDGDVNADGVVNVIDIVQIVNQVLGNDFADEEFLAQADINEDGTVNVLDVVLLVGQVLGYEE